MSKTYLDRSNPQGPYVFISYSHKDREDVEKSLAVLNGMGANFWYDTELRGGQIWIDKVKEVTGNKNCVGIIYFISPDFVYSDSCLAELDLFEKLKETHPKFDVMCVLTDDKGSANLDEFVGGAFAALSATHPGEFIGISKRLAEFSEKFNKLFSDARIYRHVAKQQLDSDSFTDMLFTEAFVAWGCASEEVDKLDMLKNDRLIDTDYYIKSRCRISLDSVSGVEIDWKVFTYKGDAISAIPVLKTLYDTTCRSLALSVMDAANENINLSERTDVSEEDKKKKHFKFDEEFLACLNKDDKGNVLRYLRANEHEKYYLQIKEALESVAVADAPDDGYFFVQDNQGNLCFADRESDDVYRHIHVDAYASVIPVIDIDYVKYKEYVLKNEKA